MFTDKIGKLHKLCKHCAEWKDKDKTLYLNKISLMQYYMFTLLVDGVVYRK